jgi:hypothetical protein
MRCLSSCLAIICIVGLLAGCRPPGSMSDSPVLIPLDGPQRANAETAMIQLPAEFDKARLGVTRRKEKILLREDMVLANDTALPRENRLTLRTRWTGIGRLPFMGESPMAPYTVERVDALAAREFPSATTVSMVQERRNQRGRYAYRIATYADGSTCVLAWQIVEASQVNGHKGTYSLEYRFCAPNRSTATMLALYDGVNIQLNGS